jgi:hypothetical protein
MNGRRDHAASCPVSHPGRCRFGRRRILMVDLMHTAFLISMAVVAAFSTFFAGRVAFSEGATGDTVTAFIALALMVLSFFGTIGLVSAALGGI